MNRAIKSIVLALTFAAWCTAPAAAHPGHGLDMEMSPRDLAVSSASYTVQTMISRGVLDQSWSNIEPEAANFRERNGAGEWVVIFRNARIVDPSHRLLYVMVSPVGEYIAANYTGQ